MCSARRLLPYERATVVVDLHIGHKLFVPAVGNLLREHDGVAINLRNKISMLLCKQQRVESLLSNSTLWVIFHHHEPVCRVRVRVFECGDN